MSFFGNFLHTCLWIVRKHKAAHKIFPDKKKKDARNYHPKMTFSACEFSWLMDKPTRTPIRTSKRAQDKGK